MKAHQSKQPSKQGSWLEREGERLEKAKLATQTSDQIAAEAADGFLFANKIEANKTGPLHRNLTERIGFAIEKATANLQELYDHASADADNLRCENTKLRARVSEAVGDPHTCKQ